MPGLLVCLLDGLIPRGSLRRKVAGGVRAARTWSPASYPTAFPDLAFSSLVPGHHPGLDLESLSWDTR